MGNIIKDENGNVLCEARGKYIIELLDGSMTEVQNMREAILLVVGREYLDCEEIETEWLVRVHAARNIGRLIMGSEDADIIVYDYRCGEIKCFDDDELHAELDPDLVEVIRVENDTLFMYSLAQMRYLNIWERTGTGPEDYTDIRQLIDIQEAIDISVEVEKGRASGDELSHEEVLALINSLR